MYPGTAIAMNVFVSLHWLWSRQVSQAGFCNHSEVLYNAEREKKVLCYVRKQNKLKDFPFESLRIAGHIELSLRTQCLKLSFMDSTES